MRQSRPLDPPDPRTEVQSSIPKLIILFLSDKQFSMFTESIVDRFTNCKAFGLHALPPSRSADRRRRGALVAGRRRGGVRSPAPEPAGESRTLCARGKVGPKRGAAKGAGGVRRRIGAQSRRRRRRRR